MAGSGWLKSKRFTLHLVSITLDDVFGNQLLPGWNGADVWHLDLDRLRKKARVYFQMGGLHLLETSLLVVEGSGTAGSTFWLPWPYGISLPPRMGSYPGNWARWKPLVGFIFLSTPLPSFESCFGALLEWYSGLGYGFCRRPYSLHRE
jgi:hypothetical protein